MYLLTAVWTGIRRSWPSCFLSATAKVSSVYRSSILTLYSRPDDDDDDDNEVLMLMINLFAFLPTADGTGLGPKLTSLLYCENSAAPDPRKKSIVKLYKCRRPAFLPL